MSAAFWSAIREQIAELRTATSADDVIRILGPERNPYHLEDPNWDGMDGGAQGFFAGSGGDDGVDDALDDAGWERVWSSPKPGEGHCFYVMRAPDGSAITYCEGDIYRGDRRPKGDS